MGPHWRGREGRRSSPGIRSRSTPVRSWEARLKNYQGKEASTMLGLRRRDDGTALARPRGTEVVPWNPISEHPGEIVGSPAEELPGKGGVDDVRTETTRRWDRTGAAARDGGRPLESDLGAPR